jgi:DNA-binding HxlR family transcriptional regulator
MALQEPCLVEKAFAILQGRWKLLILRELFRGPQRFGALQRALPGITHKVLTQQLRALEADRILERRVYNELPLKVEYFLTPLGQDLIPVLASMDSWAKQLLIQDRQPATNSSVN